MIRAKYGDPRRDENKSRHHGQQAANHAQNQQADSDNRADDMPQVSW